jgi:hypothetical protein
MIILAASTITEASLQPKLNALLLVEDRIFRYIGMSISPMEVSNIRHNITEEEIIDLIKSKIKDLQGEELAPEQALEEHPHIKNQIIHLLRDKKLDELL